MERKFWNEKWETKPWDDEELRELQWKKLKKMIRYCYHNSPHYYRRKFDELGLKPGDIKTWEDFRKLPILVTKDEERKSQEESLAKEGHPFGLFLCCPVDKVIGVTTTGGTTGAPTYAYLFTQHDLGIAAEIQHRVYWWAGLRPGDRVANIFAQCMHGAGWPYNYGLQTMGCCPIPIGAESGTERILRQLALAKAKAMIGTAPLMEHLIERCPEVLGKPIGELGIKILISGAAPGAGIPSVRKKIEEAYGAKLFDMMGGVQGIHHVSCDSKEYYGLHSNCADFAIWREDLVDPETKEPLEIEDGVIGLGLQTMLDWEARPYLKCDFGDMLQVFTEECPGCGFRGLRMKVVGRADDMLNVKGVKIFPEGVKGVVNSFIPRVTGEMRIVLDEPGSLVEPPLKVKVEHAPGLSQEEQSALREEIRQTMRARLEVTPVIELIPPGTLERTLSSTAKQVLVEKTYEKKPRA
jgi:phenylacetate-CoA ligase